MKLIGIKQPDEYYIISKIEDHKAKLPVWLDEIKLVVLVNGSNSIDAVNKDLSTYINNGSNMSLVDSFLYDRENKEAKYMIKNNYIHTNINNRIIIILYNSIPIDENAEPVISTEINLIEAIVWYNIKEYLWKLTVTNPNQYYQLLRKAETEWSYYSINAKTANIFPKNIDSLHALTNKYLKLLPNFKK